MSARSTVYLDASALVKLVVDEPERGALEDHLEMRSLRRVTSALARVQVLRAAKVASPGPEAQAQAERVLGRCVLLAVSDLVLRDAARLASLRLRSLDAIHLASARTFAPDEFVTYDERLAEAAREQGLTVVQPGIEPRQGRRLHDRAG
jgi:predicted nucleic acid-binding protein